MNSWNSLGKDSLKKTLNFQSSIGSCFSLAPQGVSQLNKWVRVLSWTRWRSINTPHQVQGPATRSQQKSSAPDALDVAPDAFCRVSSATVTASCTCKTAITGLSSNRLVSSLVTRSVRSVFYRPLWVRDRTHTIGSGACVRCRTLGTWRTGSTLTYTGRANSNTVASDAGVRCF